MYRIKALNKISNVINDELPKARYAISDEEAAPDAILVRSAAMQEMDVPESLVAVGRAGAGVNNIPVDAYSGRGIAVFNTPGANANAVAELVLLGMLMSGRKVIDGIEWVRTLKGQPDVPKLVEKGKGQFVGPELRGKTLGVIGLGAIGAMVANAAANGLGMEVLGEDPFLSVQHALSLTRAIKRTASIEEILEKSDFVSIHVPLGEQTRGMFDAARFAQMKPGAHLLNFSRAELVDTDALKDALASGKLLTYVTDFPTDELLGLEGVLCIPHLGASTPESEENCAAMAASQLREYLENGNIRNSVNLPEILLGPIEGTRLMLIHENLPGLVNQITGEVAGMGINIASMVNRSRGGMAVTVIDVETAPPEALMAALCATPHVLRVRRVGA